MVAPSPAAPKPVRAMVDATVLFAGTGWPRWSYAVLLHAAARDFDLVLSPSVIEQARRNLQAKVPQFVQPFDAWLRQCPYELVADPSAAEVAASLTLMRDASDLPIALSAIHSRVDCLVSEDKDFTAIDETTAELRRHLKVLRPVIFLREVMGWSREDLEKIRYRNWPREDG